MTSNRSAPSTCSDKKRAREAVRGAGQEAAAQTFVVGAPVFLDVGQIVSGYSWERGVSVSGQLAKTEAHASVYLGLVRIEQK